MSVVWQSNLPANGQYLLWPLRRTISWWLRQRAQFGRVRLLLELPEAAFTLSTPIVLQLAEVRVTMVTGKQHAHQQMLHTRVNIAITVCQKTKNTLDRWRSGMNECANWLLHLLHHALTLEAVKVHQVQLGVGAAHRVARVGTAASQPSQVYDYDFPHCCCRDWS